MIKKFFLVSAFCLLIGKVGYCVEKNYVPINGYVVCQVNKEFDWPYDCNKCPDGYFVRSLDHKMVDQKGSDVKLGVTIAECSKPIFDRPFKTIFELSQAGDGEYNTEGYVIWKNKPWVCPEDAACARWIPEIVIAESFKGGIGEFEKVELSSDELLMSAEFFHARHEDIEVGAKYRFSVQKYYTERSGGYYKGIGFELIH